MIPFLFLWSLSFQRTVDAWTQTQQLPLWSFTSVTSRNSRVRSFALYAQSPDADEESHDATKNHLNTHSQHTPNSVQHQQHSSSRNSTAHYEHQYRVARARAKIDALLSGPDAPIDLERELQRVQSIAPPTAPARPQDLLKEERVSQLQEQLNHAIQTQDFDAAASAQKEIGQLHVDDCGAVLQVNAAYYRAFSRKDVEAMQAVWMNDNTATCIHPSQKALVGSRAVLQSWQRMFATSNGAFQKTWMEPHNIRITVKGATTAIITCDEHVYARRFVRGQKRTTELVNKLSATNVFSKAPDGQWYMTHHHASWHADSDAAKQALTFREKGGSVSKHQHSSTSAGGKTQRQSDELDEDEEARIAMDGILGINKFGPLLGDEGGNDEDKKGNGMIMGSLSDIINSGLGDILSSSDSDLPNNINPLSGPKIIRVSRFNPSDSDENGISQSESDAFMDDLMDAYDEDDDMNDEGSDDENEDDHDDHQSKNEKSKYSGDHSRKMTKTELRQACLAALRKLSDTGAISPRQKRVLVTDIIASTAKHAKSMVEIAFELLCVEGEGVGEDEEDSYEEEFADQCRVIATDLME